MFDLDSMKYFQPQKFLILMEIPEWARIFEVPEAEIMRQIQYAHGWIHNNPQKRPKKNIKRFIYNWLMIAQRMGSLVKNQKDLTYREPPVQEDMTFEEMQDIRRRNMAKRSVHEAQK